MNQYKLLLFLSLLLFTSCIRDIDPEFESSDQKFVVLAEIQEGDPSPMFTISTTFELNSSPQELSLANTDVSVDDEIGPGVGEFSPRDFRPVNGDDLRFEAQAGSFTPAQGERYFLKVTHLPGELPELTGETFMPYVGSVETVNNVSLVAQTADYSEFDIDLVMGEMPDLNTFYHLMPFIKANDGSEIYPDIVSIDEGRNGSFVLAHRHGMLVDYNTLEDTKNLSFTLRTLIPLNVDQLVDNKMYFKLRTVTEEYFKYHRSVSRQYETDRSPFTIPVLTYSQFEHGFGVFSAFSEVFTSAEIQ